ncbi:unnamed protein product [Linum trigynum]|uniref:Uncharacterized protein n=1 Tax=Linum trigynum TaxID=586398 RepID=A0AAV2EXT8_9ROSI
MALPNNSSCFFTIFFALVAVLPLLPATSSATGHGKRDGGHFCYEDCLRRAFALSPPPPSSNNGGVISRSVICKDKGRVVVDTVKLTGKLPRWYLQALCHVLKHEDKVEAYVEETFRGQDAKRLWDGQSCKTVTAGKPDRCSTG